MTSILEGLVRLESEISYRVPPPPGAYEFDYLPGNIPVLLSAPHAARHLRQGELKDEDEYTAAIAKLVAEFTGAHVLYATHQSGTDPNRYPGVPYKQKLMTITQAVPVGFVLDIHGAAHRRPFGLALGTMHGQSCPQQRQLILDTLADYGFAPHLSGLASVDVDHAFPAAGSEQVETVTRYVWQELHIPAAQLEINAALRIVVRKADASLPKPYQGDPSYIERTVIAITAVVRALSRSLSR